MQSRAPYSYTKNDLKILSATIAQIEQYQLEDIGVRDVARAAGVTTPTLYNRFGSKDALISAALDYYYNTTVSTALEQSPFQSREIYKQLFEIGDIYARACREQPNIVRALMAMHYKMDSPSAVQSVFDDNCRIFGQILSAMVSFGELRPGSSTDFLATVMTEACYSAALAWCQGKVLPEKLAGEIHARCALLVHGVAKREIARALEPLITTKKFT